jgi:glyoxylase-like metal-dependent hydrolase (beta-lactamase superfamily II)
MAGRWVDAPLSRNSGYFDSGREVAARLRGARDICFFEAMMTVRVFAALVAATSLAQFDCVPRTNRPQAGVYQVTAVRFATEPSYPTRFLVAGADSTRHTPLAFTVWLIQGSDRVVLMDAGFYRQKFIDRWKPENYARPGEVLAANGVKPESVTDIVISHIHWDHLDGADLFPKARVWLQRAEYEHYTNDSGAVLDRAIDPDDAKMLASLRASGRVRLVDGDSVTIMPGITVFTGGKHTFASQYAAVKADLGNDVVGTIVLASDNAYLYENLEQHRPITQSLDTLSNLRAQERMRRLASNPRLIVPGHDVEVFVRFPKPGNGVARIE